jgi:ferredoxin
MNPTPPPNEYIELYICVRNIMCALTGSPWLLGPSETSWRWTWPRSRSAGVAGRGAYRAAGSSSAPRSRGPPRRFSARGAGAASSISSFSRCSLCYSVLQCVTVCYSKTMQQCNNGTLPRTPQIVQDTTDTTNYQIQRRTQTTIPIRRGTSSSTCTSCRASLVVLHKHPRIRTGLGRHLGSTGLCLVGPVVENVLCSDAAHLLCRPVLASMIALFW